MAAVLLGMAGLNAFDCDPEPQPPDRELRELKQSVRGSERDSVVRADCAGQAAFPEKPLKRLKSKLCAVGFHRLAKQQIPGGVIGDRQRIAVSFVAELELALIVGAPEIVRAEPVG